MVASVRCNCEGLRVMGNTVAIVGAGHAAGQVVATLRQKKFDGTNNTDR